MRRTKYPVVLQQDETDCGVACLLSVIRFYGGNHSLETLRRMSGTQTGGTSLLGLHQSAGELGFDATGTQLSIEWLLEQETPCILHVLVDGHALHYVVFYGCTQRHGKTVFIIGDPAKGLCHLTEAALAEIWQSKIALLLTPNSAFQTVKAVQKVKWQWIRNFIREDMPTLSIAVALGIAIAILGITMAIFSQRLVDDILPRKDFSKFYISIAMVLVLLLIKEGLSVIRQFFLLRQSRDFNIRIADFFYNHLLRLPKPFFDSRKIGELTSRLNDTGRIQRVISQLAGSAIIDSLVALFSIGFLFSYSWEIGLSSLLFIPLFYLLIYWHNKQIIAGQQSVMTGYAFTEGNYISTLHGIDAIKNHHKEAVFAQSNKAIYQKYQDHLFSLGKVNIRLSWMANTVGVLFLIALLFFAGDQVLAGHMKSGQLIAVLGICTSLLPSIAHLAMVSIPLHEAKIAFDRMFDFTSMAVESKAAPDAISAFESLQVQALSFRFPGRQKLLQDISFEVKKGEMVALVGENGCGKSTILQILQKHYTAAAGNILVNEHCAFHLINLTAWRSLVSVVPQQVHIFNTTILENIAFEEAGTQTEKVLAFLHRHGFDKFFNRLPQSYATLVGEEGINLSGGQKQLIGLARALYQQPQLLLLDEATAAMDRDTEHFVLHLLDELKPSMGIIFITHRMHILKSFCQRIYILENGTITHRGHHNELLQAKNLYSAYWADLN